MIWMITGAAFLTMLVLFLVIGNVLTADKRIVGSRLQQFVNPPLREEKRALQEPAGMSSLTGWRGLIRQLSRPFESRQWSRFMEHKLVQAGLPMRGSEFLVICLGTALFGALLFFAISGGSLFLGAAGAAGGYLTPVMTLRVKIERRMKAFNGQLGDCLILVANSLRTGYSFMQSLEMVAREMPRPISEEFARVLKEMNLGVTTEQALNNLVKRVNSDDLDLVVTAVLIQRQVGGNLAEILDNIAHTIRQRVKIKGQIKTLTAQGRVSGIIISILPVGIGGVIYAINPGYIQTLFTHPMGKAMLAAGAVSQLIGILLIRKIVNIEV